MTALKRGKSENGDVYYSCHEYTIFVEGGSNIDDFIYEAFNHLFASGWRNLWIEKSDIKEFRKSVKGILIH